MKHTIRFVLACRFRNHHQPKIELWRWECPFNPTQTGSFGDSGDGGGGGVIRPTAYISSTICNIRLKIGMRSPGNKMKSPQV